MTQWTAITDKLPDYDEPVLWYLEDGNMVVEALDKDGNPWLFNEDDDFVSAWGDCPKATHWQYLPEPPSND